MIAISTELFDLNGDHVYDGLSEPLLNTTGFRRTSKTATLDGGAVIFDGGYSDADRDIKIIKENFTEADLSFTQYIIKTYGRVLVSTDEGVFVCVPDRFFVDGRELEFDLLILEKVG
jgi:hypothetical protein